jgi:hypothetical protein
VSRAVKLWGWRRGGSSFERWGRRKQKVRIVSSNNGNKVNSSLNQNQNQVNEGEDERKNGRRVFLEKPHPMVWSVHGPARDSKWENGK